MKHLLPQLEKHSDVIVARDTLQGGTKSRYLWQLFQKHVEICYASSAEGGAQAALAYTAQRWGKRATIIGPARATPSARQLEVQKLGAQFIGIRPGYMNVCEARAKAYAEQTGAYLLPFGCKVPNATDVIAETACALKIRPDVVWCAAGSGTLANGLKKAWPRAELHYVQVGAEIEIEGGIKHTSQYKYSWCAPDSWCPFDTCGTYERKAWVMLKQWQAITRTKAKILFWSPMTAAKI